MNSHIDIQCLFDALEKKLFTPRQAIKYTRDGEMEFVALQSGEMVNKSLLTKKEREALCHMDGFDVASRAFVLETIARAVDYIKQTGSIPSVPAPLPVEQTRVIVQQAGPVVVDNTMFCRGEVLPDGKIGFFTPGFVLSTNETIIGFHLCTSDAITVPHIVKLHNVATGTSEIVFNYTEKSNSSTVSRFVKINFTQPGSPALLALTLDTLPEGVKASMQLIIRKTVPQPQLQPTA